jgi:deazaflavin-dependent oxidoreductase (nitroreductase family)
MLSSVARLTDLETLAAEQYAYLTTTGRVSGEPREIEIWFAVGSDRVLYLLSGGGDRSDWFRNIGADPRVSVRIGSETFDGTARIVEDPEEAWRARDLIPGKYESGYSGDLSDYKANAIPVAIDLDA